MLHRLARTLDTNVSRLLDPDPDGELVQINRGNTSLFLSKSGIRTGNGISLEVLVNPSLSRLLQVNFHQVEPDGTSDGLISHEGEEFGYVIEGQLEITIGDSTYSLAAGDSFFFPSLLEHGYRNAGKTRTTVLWVNTPPTF